MRFDGDIIITDPCYIDSEDDKLWNDNEIDIMTGSGIDKYQFTNYIWENTLYGDWSCGVFEISNKELLKLSTKEIINNHFHEENFKEIGGFCADAGLVGVFLLSEVLRFNPKFQYPVNKHGCIWATHIKDFHGEVDYEVMEDGETVIIRGKGNINFITIQSGF
jgi:hypothetical protein